MDQPSGKGAIHTGSPQSFIDFRPISPHFTQPIRIFRPKKTLSLDVLYARYQNKIDCPVSLPHPLTHYASRADLDPGLVALQGICLLFPQVINLDSG